MLDSLYNDLAVVNSLSSVLSKKHFTCPSFLNGSFAGQSDQGCRSLPFIPLNASCQSLLFEKSTDSHCTFKAQSGDGQISTS